MHNNYDEVVNIVHEFENRTGLQFEFDKGKKMIQGDVNNYIFIYEDGSMERVGGYVKELADENKGTLDYDLPIINTAIVEYLVNGTRVEDTILGCNDLIKFQKVVKVSSKYAFGVHNGVKQSDKVFRVFASTDQNDGIIGKCKYDGATVEKFANTPEQCFVENGDIINTKVPSKLDKQWYVDLAKDRIYKKFGVTVGV